MHPSLSASAIADVATTIRPYIRHTPVVAADLTDFGLPAHPLQLKLELLQHSGSFKARGAFANLLTRAVPAAGVVAASGGNHGAAVAYAARRLGMPANIFVPTISSPAKLERIRGWVADSGEGRWTVQAAIDLDVPAPVITLSLMARLRSRQDESYGAQVIAALRNQFGGHAVKEAAPEDGAAG